LLEYRGWFYTSGIVQKKMKIPLKAKSDREQRGRRA